MIDLENRFFHGVGEDSEFVVGNIQRADDKGLYVAERRDIHSPFLGGLSYGYKLKLRVNGNEVRGYSFSNMLVNTSGKISRVDPRQFASASYLFQGFIMGEGEILRIEGLEQLASELTGIDGRVYQKLVYLKLKGDDSSYRELINQLSSGENIEIPEEAAKLNSELKSMDNQRNVESAEIEVYEELVDRLFGREFFSVGNPLRCMIEKKSSIWGLREDGSSYSQTCHPKFVSLGEIPEATSFDDVLHKPSEEEVIRIRSLLRRKKGHVVSLRNYINYPGIDDFRRSVL